MKNGTKSSNRNFHASFLPQFEKIDEIWKVFEKMKKLSPILAFYLKPLKNGSQLKSV
jgi:hypothetical protein